MREFKFRGKDIYTDEWIFGYYSQALEPMDDWPVALSYITDFDGDIHIVFPDTVAPFTGIEGRNMQEIFEDDIVKTKSGKIQTVVWLPNKCAFICLTVGSNSPKLLDFSDEVIGNVFDNPELLQ